jgi:hypothetical protein
MLSKPILHSRIGKWALALTEYSLTYKPLKAVKGQIVADFIADPLQEKHYFLTEIIPHKVLISATKCIFIGGSDLPLNHMPVNLLAEISATKSV